MNLADAIRSGGKSWKPAVAAVPARPEAPSQAPPDHKLAETAQAAVPQEPEASKESSSPAQPVPEPKPVATPEVPTVASGNVVRLELFLSGEQMAGMLRALLAGQHSVLTLKEASTYLRLSPAAVQELADQGNIPGVVLDGKWRFPKASLDEWMNSCAGSRQAMGPEEAENVA